MNCFQARQEFIGFWRGELDAERRRALLAHLTQCARCDKAFRAFALTAPLLHARGEAAPAAAANRGAQASPAPVPVRLDAVRRTDARRTAEILRHASAYRRAEGRPHYHWRELAAGLSAMAAAMLLMYFSIAAPVQSFDEAVSNSDLISETAVQPDNDLLGQQIPSLPAPGNNLAG
ncbi:MAG TPA: zf-HC2 domain-containing protein [Candidatus Binataceae bacterium]|nr:zf-HC2 domain-containing protein [Candidatus Binataceae bacterium]